MKVEDSNTQLHVTTGGGGKTGGSISQGQRPDSFCCYECGKQVHIYVNLPLRSSVAQVHTQFTSEHRDDIVTPRKTSQTYENTCTNGSDRPIGRLPGDLEYDGVYTHLGKPVLSHRIRLFTGI